MSILDSVRTIETLTAALCEFFGSDPSAPSVITSQITPGKHCDCEPPPPWHGKTDDAGRCWYGSLARYQRRFGEGKVIIAKAYGKTLDEVYQELGRQFLVITGNGPAMLALRAAHTKERK